MPKGAVSEDTFGNRWARRLLETPHLLSQYHRTCRFDRRRTIVVGGFAQVAVGVQHVTNLCGVVVSYVRGSVAEHHRATVGAVAQMVAILTGRDFEGEYDPAARYRRPLYFVPSDTLLVDEARALGIRTRDDLFGGVVPFPFVATKAIVHPLVAPDARCPPGWSYTFADRVRETVLPGFTAFTVQDARRAAAKLLESGRVRLKQARGIGGHGQLVVAGAPELESALRGLDATETERYGVGIELDLGETATYSIGQVRIDDLQGTYWGTQCVTTDNAGATAFGGSDITMVRGGYEALARLPLEPIVRLAIDQAVAFDAATEAFAGLFASRRNYDVLHGRDDEGGWHCGVLEQSWRLGGASGPEVAALAAFRTDPALHAVRARSVECYGSSNAPPNAIIQFSGVDSCVGALTKYTTVEPHDTAP
jgi:Protein of unknown function (DUF3182)